MHDMEQSENRSGPLAPWEWIVVGVSGLAALFLGFSRLDVPSLWHDELVHVFVAKHIAAHFWPALPSGEFYPSSMVFNSLLAGVVALFGDSAVSVRAPSVLLSALNVALLYFLIRGLLGRPAAIAAIIAFTLSPWHVAWARQARLYEFQLCMYLLAMHASWIALESTNRKQRTQACAGAVSAYIVAALTSYHSIVFVGSIGAYAGCMLLYERRLRSRWTVALGLCTLLGALTLGILFFNPNQGDQQAVFSTGLGGVLGDPQRAVRSFYLRWLDDNLSTGFLWLAFLGTLLAPWREKRRGLFAALAFWTPLLVLTYAVGYRRPRFIYFAFPFYVALYSYALVQLLGLLLKARKSWRHGLTALIIFLFLCRLGVSAAKLTANALETSRGAHTTLARRHPQWKKPCAYVRAHRTNEAVLTTTCLPVMYYVGHVDNWFPNRYQWWEGPESGFDGIASLEELRDFVAEHPRGYYIAEWERFEKWKDHTWDENLRKEVDWVRANMRRVNEACSDDVTVYAWGF
jgi:hypothetical protein